MAAETDVAAPMQVSPGVSGSGKAPHSSAGGKHKKQKRQVLGAADFSPEEVAERQSRWQRRQGSVDMQALNQVRRSLPIASMRSVLRHLGTFSSFYPELLQQSCQPI